jgi:uncharacterized C2H2 Zn-finger protein
LLVSRQAREDKVVKRIEKKKVFECKECGKVFKNAQSLNGHAIRVHRKQDNNSDQPATFECKQCGRIFKSTQALGGHVMRVHQKQHDELASEKPDREKVVQVESGEEASEAEQIRSYLQQGLTYEDLMGKLHFKETTVRQEMAKMIIAERQAEKGEEESLLPVVLKDGKGETISPEAVYYQLVREDGLDGARDFKALMKWAASIELAQRMAQVRKTESEATVKMFEPMLEMIEKSRQELDAAAQRNREAMMEVASAAAGEAAARVASHDDERFSRMQQPQKKDIAEVQDPMKGLLARTMETILNQITGTMFGGGQQGGQPSLPPGWQDKTKTGG